MWAYLGPKDKEPPFPRYRFFDYPEERIPIYHVTVDCNFVQVMEGTIDPSHAGILHKDTVGTRYTNKVKEKGDRLVKLEGVEFVSEDLAPHCEVRDTLFGCEGGAVFDALAVDDERPLFFARGHIWVLPFLAMPLTDYVIQTVPIDDHRTAYFSVHPPKEDKASRDRYVTELWGPSTHYDGYHFRYGADERWGQDRTKMDRSFTGLGPGVVVEDIAMTSSMGSIYDRTRENLVPADQLVIRMRRRMLQAVRDLESGIEPFHLTPEETIRLGSEWQLVANRADWPETMPGNEPFRIADVARN